MKLVIELEPLCAEELISGKISSPAAHEAVAAAKRHGITLEPMHRGTRDPALRVYFQTEDGSAEAVDRLRRCRAVKAAYLKPPDELP